MHGGVRDRVVLSLSQARALADAVPTRMSVYHRSGDNTDKANHVCDLPPLRAYLHHHHVHHAVRGEDLGAEERINLHCDINML